MEPVEEPQSEDIRSPEDSSYGMEVSPSNYDDEEIMARVYSVDENVETLAKVTRACFGEAAVSRVVAAKLWSTALLTAVDFVTDLVAIMIYFNTGDTQLAMLSVVAVGLSSLVFGYYGALLFTEDQTFQMDPHECTLAFARASAYEKAKQCVGFVLGFLSISPVVILIMGHMGLLKDDSKQSTQRSWIPVLALMHFSLEGVFEVLLVSYILLQAHVDGSLDTKYSSTQLATLYLNLALNLTSATVSIAGLRLFGLAGSEAVVGGTFIRRHHQRFRQFGALEKAVVYVQSLAEVAANCLVISTWCIFLREGASIVVACRILGVAFSMQWGSVHRPSAIATATVFTGPVNLLALYLPVVHVGHNKTHGYSYGDYGGTLLCSALTTLIMAIVPWLTHRPAPASSDPFHATAKESSAGLCDSTHTSNCLPGWLWPLTTACGCSAVLLLALLTLYDQPQHARQQVITTRDEFRRMTRPCAHSAPAELKHSTSVA